MKYRQNIKPTIKNRKSGRKLLSERTVLLVDRILAERVNGALRPAEWIRYCETTAAA